MGLGTLDEARNVSRQWPLVERRHFAAKITRYYIERHPRPDPFNNITICNRVAGVKRAINRRMDSPV